jgi:hypothetical protein
MERIISTNYGESAQILLSYALATSGELIRGNAASSWHFAASDGFRDSANLSFSDGYSSLMPSELHHPDRSDTPQMSSLPFSDRLLSPATRIPAN